MISGDKAQEVTIRSYEDNVQEYCDKDTRDSRTLDYWPGVEYFLGRLRKGQAIFEIGTGDGFGALKLEQEGFRVIRSDVTGGFIDRLKSHGFEVEEYNVLLPSSINYSAVYANAVLLHFNIEQFRTALGNIFNSLSKKGLLCLGMKLGEFEGWREKGLSGRRYFKYWNREDLINEVESCGFRVINSYLTPGEDYIIITAQSLKEA